MSRTIRKRKEKSHWDRRNFVDDNFQLDLPHKEYHSSRPYRSKITGKVHGEYRVWRIEDFPFSDINWMLKKYKTPNIEQAKARAFYEYHSKGYRRQWLKPWVRNIVERTYRQQNRLYFGKVLRGDEDAVDPVLMRVVCCSWYWD